MTTETKIRNLCNEFGISTILENKFNVLTKELFKSENHVDGPKLIVKCRNAFVHGDLEDSFYQIKVNELYLVFDLVSAYVELILIKLLDVKLAPHDRLKNYL
jgi:hypothetical protein